MAREGRVAELQEGMKPSIDDTLDNQEEGNRVNTCYAYICINEQGDEGIAGLAFEGLGVLKLVGSHQKMVEAMRPMAEQIARTSRHKVKLIKFTNREDLEEIS